MNTIDDDLFANVHNLEICIIALVAVSINRLVDFFILADALAEIPGGVLWVLALVVWAGGLDIENVGHDDLLLVAFALDEENFHAVGLADLVNPFAPLLCRIGRVEDAYNTASFEPFQHVSNSSLSRRAALSFALCIVEVEKVGRWMWRIVAPVVADVEGLGRDGQPLQVTLG